MSLSIKNFKYPLIESRSWCRHENHNFKLYFTNKDIREKHVRNNFKRVP